MFSFIKYTVYVTQTFHLFRFLCVLHELLVQPYLLLNVCLDQVVSYYIHIIIQYNIICYIIQYIIHSIVLYYNPIVYQYNIITSIVYLYTMYNIYYIYNTLYVSSTM